MHNVVIIGSGCAGLTAAIYAGRANLKPLIIDGHEQGGQLSLTTHVENYPGFPDGVMGPELIDNMRKQAQKFGAEFKAGAVNEVDLTQRPFKITAGKETYEAKTLIVAAGASARLLGLPGEKELIGRGLSTCATCDGLFFPRESDRRCRRRRFRDGRSKFSDSLCQQGLPRSPAQRISRLQDHD